MDCPDCGGATTVTDSRAAGRFSKRRRRECSGCSKRFSTYEIIEGAVDQTVVVAVRMVMDNGRLISRQEVTHLCACGNEARYIVDGEGNTPRFCALCDQLHNDSKGTRR